MKSLKSSRSPLFPAGGALLIIFFLMIIGGVLYGDIGDAPFVGDDIPNIVQNPHIRMTHLTLDQIVQVRESPSPRPLSNLTFALNHYIHRYRVFGYHFVNLLLHVITAVLIFYTAGYTLRLCRSSSLYITPFAAALFWLAHPLHTQSVTYIVQRMNLLAALFYILALLCYIIARVRMRAHDFFLAGLLFAASLLAGCFGLASKEIVATLPLIVFLYEYFFFQDFDFAWLKNKTGWIIVVIGVFGFIAALYLGFTPLETLHAQYFTQDFSPMQRLLTEPLVIVYYLSLLAFPHPARLNLLYTFPLSHSILWPPITLLCLAVIALLLLVAVDAARKHRLAAFAVLWFFITVSVESSVVGLAIIFEHRTYLPSIFLIIGFIAIIESHSTKRAHFLFFALVFILLSGFWTWQRNQVWQGDIALWQDCAAKSPQHKRVFNHLGIAYEEHGDYHSAIRYFQESLHVNPVKTRRDNIQAIISHTSLGRGNLKLKKIDMALNHYRRALELCQAKFGRNHPQAADIHSVIGEIYQRENDLEASLSHCKKALIMRLHWFGPRHIKVAESCQYLGDIYVDMQNRSQAMRYLKQSLNIYRHQSEENKEKIVELYNTLSRLNQYDDFD